MKGIARRLRATLHAQREALSRIGQEQRYDEEVVRKVEDVLDLEEARSNK